MHIHQRVVSAIWLIIVGVILLAADIAISMFVYPYLRHLFPAYRLIIKALVLCATCVIVAAGYWLAIRAIERRPVSELAPGAAGRWGASGLGLGLGLFCVTIAGLVATGTARSAGFAGFGGTPMMLLSSSIAAVTEEIIFRGAFYQAVEKLGGRPTALLVSAVLFGLVHALNPGATPMSTLAIAVEAGLLLGLAFAYARNLWFPIGVYLGWNFCEGGVFGAAVSGGASSGVFPMALHGPDLLTGGAFGPEASVVAMLVSLAASLALGWRLLRVERSASVAPPSRSR